jgi:hypothetical protein
MDFSSPWLLIESGCAIACAASGLAWAYRRAKVRPKPPARAGSVLDTVGFAARGGRAWVRGEYLPVPGGRAAVVLVGGRDGRRHHGLTQALRTQGLSVLVIQRRGGSGQRERDDVLGAVDYLLDRGHPPGRIGVMGSTGSQAVLDAAADEPAIRAVLPVAHPARAVAFFRQHLMPPRTVCVIWPQPARATPAAAWERLAA